MSHLGKCFRERTGLSPGQYRETTFPRTYIYNYFQSKEEIFLALLKWEYDLWIEALEEAMEKAGVPYISPSVYGLVYSNRFFTQIDRFSQKAVGFFILMWYYSEVQLLRIFFILISIPPFCGGTNSDERFHFPLHCAIIVSRSYTTKHGRRSCRNLSRFKTAF